MGNMLKGPQVPPLYDTLTGLQREIMKSLRCCVPGNIKAFYPVNRTVDVEIALMQQGIDGVSYAYPKLTGCPVITLQGGNVGMAFPITVNDECLVFFSDRCLDSWFKTGSPQPLPTLRMHDLSDGFALIGVNSLANTLSLALLVGEGGIADEGARMAINSITHKIAISNGAEKLSMILTDLVTTLAGISTIPGGGPLNAASIAALTAYIARINNLLYP